MKPETAIRTAVEWLRDLYENRPAYEECILEDEWEKALEMEKYLNTLDDEEKDLSFTSMQRASHKLLEISLEELHLLDYEK